MRSMPLYFSVETIRICPICPVRVQCVPPRGGQVEAFNRDHAHAGGGLLRVRLLAEVQLRALRRWETSMSTATSLITTAFTRSSARWKSASAIPGRATSIVHDVRPRRAETVSARAASARARESACCAVCCTMLSRRRASSTVPCTVEIGSGGGAEHVRKRLGQGPLEDVIDGAVLDLRVGDAEPMRAEERASPCRRAVLRPRG